MTWTRRDFLKLAGAAGLVFMAPPALATQVRNRVVVLVELNGGNDGLNTVVPYRDPLYYRLRPSLALAEPELRTLDDEVALHPSLEALSQAWEDGDVALVEGLGYPRPNRSHFRSIEIWDSATSADEYATRGWVSRVVPDATLRNFTPAALVVGPGDDGPVGGANTLALDDPEALFRVTNRLERVNTTTGNPALDHVLHTQNDLLDAVDVLRRYVDRKPSFSDVFGDTAMQRPMRLVAELIASGLPLLAVKIRLPGFDTHVRQRQRHARLLTAVDEGIGNLRKALQQAGCWDDVLIVTYSEFGRRPRENGGAGTDHGTAAPHFVVGGRVRGGRYGRSPSLEDLDGNGDLRHTVDFRSLYSTIASDWWGLEQHELSDFKVLPFI